MSGVKDLEKFKKVTLDTNIFIYYYQQNPEFISFVDKIFDLLARNKLKAVTSLLTLAELLSLKADEAKIQELEDSFLSTPNLSIISFDQKVAKDAARIKRAYDFRLPDCIQLATALQTQVNAFITNDKRLRPFTELPVIILGQA